MKNDAINIGKAITMLRNTKSPKMWKTLKPYIFFR